MQNPVRLPRTQIAAVRIQILEQQNMRCALCNLPLAKDKAVLDHCHSTGYVRAVLHSSCNALLGKLENGMKRFGVTNSSAFLHGAASYIQQHAVPQTNLLHPLYRDDEAKRLRKNKLARVRRAKLKDQE